MKFNGEIWRRIPVTTKSKDDPDEFVIARNPKFAGGLIPYARYGSNWTTTVPNRILIRELLLHFDRMEKDLLDLINHFEKEKTDVNS